MAALQAPHVRIRVPATTSNLGAGFDALGMALGLGNLIEAVPSERFSLTNEGEGASTLPRDDTNVTIQAFRRGCIELGIAAPAFALRAQNAIPPARGLGSSAAAAVAGLVLADAVSGGALGRDRMLSLATDIEGHPDNAAPALFGGVQCAVVAAGRIHRLTVEAPSLPAVVLFVPSFEMSTREARAVLAPTVSRNDAVFNLSRAALLVGALVSGRFDLLGVATEDRIHQPARSTIFPLLPALLDAARGAGAFGAWLSGAGSTIASFADDAHATAVAAAMEDCARSAGLDGRTLITSVDLAGASFSHVQ